MHELVVRSLQPGEEHLFLNLTDSGLVGAASIGCDYRTRLASGEYRPEWTWVALCGDRTVARAAWWGGPRDARPRSLDWFDFENPTAGEALLRAASIRTNFCLILPTGWRKRPVVRAAANSRIRTAESAGMTTLVERYHYIWTLAAGLPERPGRLRYRPEPDDDIVGDVLRRIMRGSLDARTRRTVRDNGVEAAVREQLDFLRWMPNSREWRRLAYTPGGDLVGITAPGHNYTGPLVGFVGVVPAHRGNGYAYDLSVEAMHLLVEQGAERITADADATNTPMVEALARAGFPIAHERLYLSPPG